MHQVPVCLRKAQEMAGVRAATTKAERTPPPMTAISSARVASSSYAATSSPVLRQGATGSAVTQLQNKLRAAGHAISADGVFGPQTRAAVVAFQRAKGLSVDGIVGPQTWGALNQVGTGPVLRQGATGASVVDLQNKLRAAGLNIAADGIFGPQTRNAVIAFQRAKGLTVDGVVGPQTWGALGGVSGNPGGGTVLGYVNGQPRQITVSSIGGNHVMRSDAAAAFNNLKAAAAAAGINLHVNSAFRTQAEQAELYRLYLAGQGNLAAKPGYSNHQGGLSVDINMPGSYSGATYRWLQANARRFGFVNDVGGEPWHWTFQG